MKPLAPTFSSLSTSRQIKTPGDRFVQGHFKCDAATLFWQVSSACVIRGPVGHFLALLRLQASPPEPKSGSYCTIAFNQAVSCWLCTIAETVGLSPAATPGAPFIPVGKDAMTPWIFFSSQPLFYHKSHYVTRFFVRLLAWTPPKRVCKIRFFLHCIQDSPTSSFHLQKTASSLPAVKDTCLFLTYAGEILQLPLPTILDVYFRFLTTPPGSVEGKTPFLHPT